MRNLDRGPLSTARIEVLGLTLLAVSSVGALHARRSPQTQPAVDRADAEQVQITPAITGPDSLRSRRNFNLAASYHNLRFADPSYRKARLPAPALAPSGAGAAPAAADSPASPQVPAEKLEFEVVSIKVNHSGTQQFGLGLPPGRMTATNVTAKRLIEFAYQDNRNSLQLRDDQISGGPAWINSDRFDIEAKVEDSMIEKEKTLPFSEWANQVRLMLQSLLADRFQLKVHFETREMPEYALVVAKGGPKLAATTVAPLGPVVSVSGPPPQGGPRLRQVPGQITGTGMGIGNLVDALAQQRDLEGRAVVDQTGLKDRYDFTLHWTPEVQGGPNGPVLDSAPAPDEVSIFTALQEQLGLRLEATKGPVQVVVIDHVEEPSPN